MKKSFIILIIIVVLGIGIWAALKYIQPKQSQITPGEQSEKIYTNNTYGFEIKYPRDFVLNEGGSIQFTVGEFFVGQGTNLMTISLPQDSYPGTNYTDAFITISVGDKTTEAYCSKAQREGSTEIVDLGESKIIDNIQFYRGEADGAAAGTFSKDVIYHAFYNNNCYEATLNLLQTNIGNYPEGTVTQVNESEVFTKLESILDTLNFLNN